MGIPITEREKLAIRFHDLKQVRYSFDAEWKAILDQLLPYRGRFQTSDFNRARARDSKKINNTPIEAQDILAAGLMAGITSPARIWYHLTVKDKKLRDRYAVRSYLNQCEEIQREALANGRFYHALAGGVYQDLGGIGTAAMWQEPKGFGLRHEPMTVGEYWLDADDEGLVDTCFRQRPMTVYQIATKFGPDDLPHAVDQCLRSGKLSEQFEIVQAVYPNDMWEPHRADRWGKRWTSKWWAEKADGFLHEGGYEEFPVLTPRWGSVAGETYGRGSPGWKVKGDCATLQHQEERLLRLVDKSSDPPMAGSSKVANPTLLPGQFTIEDGTEKTFRQAMEVDPKSIEVVGGSLERVELRINRSFKVDLWMALLSDRRPQRQTATEVEAKQDERMLQLGPLLEGLNDDLLAPGINRSFQILDRAGVFPEPPKELQGTEGLIQAEFVSVMHRAQKMTGIVGLRDFVGIIQELAAAQMVEAIDKVNTDVLVDELADILGIKPEIVLSEDQVQEIRRAKADRQRALEQGQAALATTQGVRNLSGADPAQLQELASAISPVAGAAGGLTQ